MSRPLSLARVSRRGLAVLALAALPALAAAQQLTVSAAASLTNAFKELAPKFEATHPGVKLVFNFAASGTLIQQVAQGAPVDVFASADQAT
ncbi:molybdate ABC transporter substrate-binding protein, partial [Pseudacidovorax intermedius]|uniref:molybdate ABC transporter substrate-binding protein n=1 Tax=Pseudacidovorax intermedius TaxID=433924 RepID=UPI0005BB3947